MFPELGGEDRTPHSPDTGHISAIPVLLCRNFYQKARYTSHWVEALASGSWFPRVIWITEEGNWYRLLWKIELLFHSGGQEDYTWRARDPVRHLLVSSCSIIKVNRKLWQHNPNRMINVLDPSGIVTLLSKTAAPADVLSEKRGNTD